MRRIDTDGVITTVVGGGQVGFAGDGGPPAAALLQFQMAIDNPEPGGGLALDAQDRLYIVDTENHRIRRVDFAADIIETVAGNGTPGFSGDGGPATEASLAWPRDVALGPDGRLYIADTDNHRVRAVDLATGVITTVAGNGVAGFARRRRHADRRVAAAAVGDHVRRRRQPLHRRHDQQPHPDGDRREGPARRARALARAPPRWRAPPRPRDAVTTTQPPPRRRSPAIRRPG